VNVIMLNVIMLNVVMLNVVAPSFIRLFISFLILLQEQYFIGHV
jgi:hypothetical protein